MYIGFLTACMRKKPVEEVVKWAGEAGFTALEMASSHVGLDADPKKDDALKALLKKSGVKLSSIAHYDGGILNDPAKSVADLKKAVDRCTVFGTEVLCVLAGLPLKDKSKEDSIKERLGEVYKPVCAYAAGKGIKVAMENWYATVIQDFSLWDLALETVKADNFGFNYDPSHLLWQGIDYIGGVRIYGQRIYHVHAKDTSIDDAIRMRVGYLGRGWWRYTIPGRGRVDWGEFVSALGKAGYKGVLSIEHEDGSVGVEEGLTLGKKYLENFVV
jgi:sugar phosphate isomerase/epimerase